MFIKTPGAYLALCDQFLLLFRAVGEFPFFKVPSAIILNDYGKTGEIRTVTENSIEIQHLIANPSCFSIVTLDAIADRYLPIDFDTTTKIEFDITKFERYTDKLKLIDTYNSGISVNSLIMEIIKDTGYSVPQARMAVQELRKKIKLNDRC